jgi:SsrA-binding protein|uniref:SsrA-binding protein n=1 Tax=candidate division WOR-3 bacterium TaxID=2052148 RepID=A0A7V5XZY1_UNCW3
MKIVSQNKKAFHNYFIEETYEAGIELKGSEVKSIREGRISIDEGYCVIENNEVFLKDVHIAPYEKGSVFNPDPKRKRKLLLHKKEIKRLIGKVERRGYTLIPLKVYFNDKGKCKVEIALARGKKVIDKRKELKERALKREERYYQKYKW